MSDDPLATDPPATMERIPSTALVSRAPWWMLPTLGGMVLLLFIVGLGVAVYVNNGPLILMMCTAITVQMGTVLGFFFGSSQGSHRKDEVLAAQATNAGPLR